MAATTSISGWQTSGRLTEVGIDTRIPYTVDEDGFYTADAPGFAGKRVITDKGDKGDANDAVIAALVAAGNILARGRLKHQYPHSWRSKKPVIFRNTPQWFIAMDRPLDREPSDPARMASGEPEARDAKTLCAISRSPKSRARNGRPKRAKTASPA